MVKEGHADDRIETSIELETAHVGADELDIVDPLAGHKGLGVRDRLGGEVDPKDMVGVLRE
jgi:hypothetical protein